MQNYFSAIVYSIIMIVIGYLLNDFYKYLKNKFIKGTTPKVLFNQKCYFINVSGTNPRKYLFENLIVIQNIDTDPIYNLKLYQVFKQSKTLKGEYEFLGPTKEINVKSKISISYGDSGNKPNEAMKKVPVEFKNPSLLLTFLDKNKHKFSLKKDKYR